MKKHIKEKNNKKRPHFNFYRSFYEAIDLLSIESQGKLYKAIFDFSFQNCIKPTNLNEIENIIWTLIEPNLNKSYINYINGLQTPLAAKTKRKRSEIKIRPTIPSKDIDKEEDKEEDKYKLYPFFISFWKEYKHGSKKEAFNEYLKTKNVFPIDIILEHIKIYKTQAKEKQFMKHGNRYIKSRLWEDLEEKANNKTKYNTEPMPEFSNLYGDK